MRNNMPDQLGRYIALTEQGEKVREMVRRLIVVGVLPHAQHLHFTHLVDLYFVGAHLEVAWLREEIPQTSQQSVLAAMQLRQYLKVERRKGMVPRRALCEAVAPQL